MRYLLSTWRNEVKRKHALQSLAILVVGGLLPFPAFGQQLLCTSASRAFAERFLQDWDSKKSNETSRVLGGYDARALDNVLRQREQALGSSGKHYRALKQESSSTRGCSYSFVSEYPSNSVIQEITVRELSGNFSVVQFNERPVY